MKPINSSFAVLRSVLVLLCILALTVGMAVVSPVCADYTGDHPVTTYAHEQIHGDWRYMVGDTGYWGEISPGGTYPDSFELDIPDGSSIKIARLYAYWTWSHAGVEGTYPDMDVTFDGTEVKRDRDYTDRKGSGSYDYPSGTYCYDVTDYISGSGVYLVEVENSATESKSFSMVGLLLLVIHENEKGEELEYWINEGCDIMDMKNIEYAEDAVTTAKFGGTIGRNIDEIKSVNLVTIVPNGDKGKNILMFNDGIWNGVYAGDPYSDLAIDERDVTDYLVAKDNVVKIQDDGDYLVPSGAVMILRYIAGREEPGPTRTPTPSPSPTVTPTSAAATPSPSVSITTTPTPEVETPMPKPMSSPTSSFTPSPTGFEAVCTVAGFFIVTLYLTRRRRK